MDPIINTRERRFAALTRRETAAPRAARDEFEQCERLRMRLPPRTGEPMPPARPTRRADPEYWAAIDRGLSPESAEALTRPAEAEDATTEERLGIPPCRRK